MTGFGLCEVIVMQLDDFKQMADPVRVGVVDGPVWTRLVDQVRGGDSVAMATLVVTNIGWLGWVSKRSSWATIDNTLSAFTLAVFNRPVDSHRLRRDTEVVLRRELRGLQRDDLHCVSTSVVDLFATEDYAGCVADRLDAHDAVAGLRIPPACLRWAEHLAHGSPATASEQKNYARWRHRPSTVSALAEIRAAA